MRYGLCCSPETGRKAVELGVDYLEVGANGFNGLQTTWDPNPYRGLPIETTNCFFDGSIRLYGEGKTPYLDYAKRTIERAAEIGVKVMVIGSGGSRRAPDGYDPVGAEAEFVEIVEKIQAIAAPHNIILAPEPLTRLETNVGNDLSRLARALSSRGLAYTADSFHILKEWEFELGLEQAPMEGPSHSHWQDQMPTAPVHIHAGDLPRNYPKANDPMMIGFASRIKELGYDGRISLECNVGDIEQNLGDALAQLRQLFA